MHKMVNGVRVDLSSAEEATILTDWAENDARIAQEAIERAKTLRKVELVREKVESLIAIELAEVDAASSIADIKRVKIR